MIDRGIVIHWDYSDEYIELNINKLSEVMAISWTREWWKQERVWVRYNTESKIARHPDGSIEVKIHYSLSNNPHLRHEELAWGTATFSIAPKGHAGKAFWEDSDDAEDNGSADWQAIEPGLQKPELARQRISRIEREQQKFRSALLLEGAYCALSGERTVSSLEAAHVIPAKERGVEKITNGILLRADLHRLYDAGAFKIDPDGAVVQIVDSLSNYYRDLLSDARLDSESTARVREALLVRWRNAQQAVPADVPASASLQQGRC